MAEIYALFSSRDGIVRYVGQTGGSRDVRFKEHKRDAERWTVPPLCKWFRHEWRCGFLIECVLLQQCEDAVRRDVETKWIRKFPNYNLLNERKVGYSWQHSCKPPIISEIKNYMRHYIFNVGGYRGVQYWRQLDAYSVLVYRGGEPEWLLGDSAPGRDGNIFFSDSTRALKARETYRKGRECNWFPDIEEEMEWAA